LPLIPSSPPRQLSDALAAAAGRAAAFGSVLEEAIECTDNPLWSTETPQAADRRSPMHARGVDLDDLERSCPALADIATSSIAEAVKAEASANFGHALALLQQARSTLQEAAVSEITPLRKAAIAEALTELEERIQALTQGVQAALRAAGLRCPFFARDDDGAVTPVTQPPAKPSSSRLVRTPVSTPSRFTPGSIRQPQTPQERRLRMEEVNTSRKRLEAAAGALSGGEEPALIEDLLAAGESFGSTLHQGGRHLGGLEAAVSHLVRAVEIMRCMAQQTEGVAARALAFDNAIEILREAAGIEVVNS